MPGLIDRDGRLHLDELPISVAAVEVYRGHELIGASRVTGGRIDLNKTYRLWRSPEELEAASKTFAGLPILTRHIGVGGEIPADSIIGTTGTKTRFSNPLLCTDACIWTRQAIDGIATGAAASPSIGFAFELDLRPGTTASGELYDGKLCRLRGHHIALCADGRSGLTITPNAWRK
jgi:uncharacterized protein